jgi:hypothetical protein
MSCPPFVARELSAMFASRSGGGDAADERVMGGVCGSVRRGAGALSEAAVDGGRGRRAFGMSGRHFRRLIERYEDEGREGLRDRRLGKPSRRAPTSELMRMRRLYQECHGDFSAKHFHEQPQERHGYKLGYTVTRRPSPSVHRIGLEAARKRRPRRKCQPSAMAVSSRLQKSGNCPKVKRLTGAQDASSSPGGGTRRDLTLLS